MKIQKNNLYRLYQSTFSFIASYDDINQIFSAYDFLLRTYLGEQDEVRYVWWHLISSNYFPSLGPDNFWHDRWDIHD